MRILRQDKAVPALKKYITNSIGEKYVVSPSFDIGKAYDESKNRTPILFIISPGADGTKILTAEQKKNEGIKEQLIEVLARCEEPQQIKDLMRMEEFSEYSNQKLSALLKQLVTAEKVERVEDKKVAKFKIK